MGPNGCALDHRGGGQPLNGWDERAIGRLAGSQDGIVALAQLSELGQLPVELDSLTCHGTRTAMRRDRRISLRFTWDDIEHDLPAALADIAAAVASQLSADGP